MKKPVKVIRPIDAASLVVYKEKKGRVQVLMGRRGNSAKFQPGYYVFPGGVKERWDNSTNFINHLDKKSIKDMGVSNNQSKAHALAMTAIREAYEEVGLVFGIQTYKTQKIFNKNWRFFHENNIYPDLGALEYLGRAITPHYLPIRYHARFFSIAFEHHFCTEEVDGELEDIQWVDLSDPYKIKMMGVQKMILEILKTRIKTGRLTPKFLFFKWNRKNII
ncbi:MAG: hypothetical protein VXY22_05970 [Pseudomonadota bacterium]|nr:hypothetical protein [Pseudomonadota bacterium]